MGLDKTLPFNVVGLTGSIGSGKSYAASMFAELGATVIDADQFARQAVAKGTPALAALTELFGKDILLKDGSLNRKKLGKIVFKDGDKRKLLEQVVHPEVRKLFIAKLTELRQQTPPPRLVIYVIPLLFESGGHYQEIEKVVVVYAPKEVCIKRTMERDDCDYELARKKYEAQLPGEEKVRRADLVIRNEGSPTELRAEVTKAYNALRELDKI